MKKLLIFFSLLLAVLLVVLVTVPRAELYRLGVGLGYAPAQVELGDLYRLGHSVRQDDTEAVRLFTLAANKGNSEGQHLLGFMYDVGRGVPKDYAEALKWYRRSAEQGHPVSQNNIAWLLATAPDKEFRDGAEALQLALQLVNNPEYASVPTTRSTLAAAYAEVGKFDDAVRELQFAIILLRPSEVQVASEFESRLELYRRGQPYRE